VRKLPSDPVAQNKLTVALGNSERWYWCAIQRGWDDWYPNSENHYNKRTASLDGLTVTIAEARIVEGKWTRMVDFVEDVKISIP
jgi:hypothetical protein